ncbi:choline dehydrogenase [Bradyrhizobium sp. USDA 4516]
MGAEQYTYIIAGGGSAGCVFAARLSEEPSNRVLLLESGGSDWSPLIRIPIGVGKVLQSGFHSWIHSAEPSEGLAGRRITWKAGRVIGGSSSINGLVYTRGHASDYDHWRQLGNPGWGYADVLPYFLKAEGHSSRKNGLHSKVGPLRVREAGSANPLYSAFVRAGVEAGFRETDDFNEFQEGFGRYDFNIHNGRRWSVVRAYLDRARKRSNLHVITRAHVTRVLFEQQRAIGVEYRRFGTIVRAMADAEVILSAGAIRSPALLLQSGIGDSRALAELDIPVIAHRPEVGRNLQDHASLPIQFGCSQPTTMYSHLRMDRAALMMIRALVLRTGLGATVPCEAGAFTRTRHELAVPDIQWVFRTALEAGGRVRWPGARRGPVEREGFTIAVSLQRPESRGSVSLASPDPLAPPKVDHGFLSMPNDLATMIAAVSQVLNVAAQPALAPFINEVIAPGSHVKNEDETADWIRATIGSGYHWAGSCRMGGDDAAVVDPELRVRGVEGLRIIDGSIMPRVVSGCLNAPIIMIAEKAADLIRRARHA